MLFVKKLLHSGHLINIRQQTNYKERERVFMRKNAARNSTRNRILSYVQKYPGLHLNELVRKLDLSKSTINYHLKHLCKLDLLVAKQEGRYIRYYVRNQVGEIDKKIINIIRQNTPYKIILYLILRPNPSQIELSKSLNKHPTTISFHINKLMQNGIVECEPTGNEIHYNVKNQQRISELLIKYGDVFLDRNFGESPNM